MAKIVRSLRVDDRVFDLIDSYNDFRVQVGLSRVPQGDLIESAVRFYLADQMVSLKSLVSDIQSRADRFTDDLSSDFPEG